MLKNIKAEILRKYIEDAGGDTSGGIWEAWKRFAQERTGKDGSLTDVTKEWLRLQGARGESLADLWYDFADEFGFAGTESGQRGLLQSSIIEESVFFVKASSYDADNDRLTDLSGNGNHAVLGSTTGSDTNDPTVKLHKGTNYVHFPGTNEDFSTPDTAVLDIAGDITLMTRIAMTTPASQVNLVSKNDSGTTGSYSLRMQASTSLVFQWVDTGPASNTRTSSVNLDTVASDGDLVWIAAELNVDNGSTQHEVKFWYSLDGANDPNSVTWTQLGTTSTTAGVTDIQNSAEDLQVGARKDSNPTAGFNGDMYYAAVGTGLLGDDSYSMVAEFSPDAGTIAADHTTITNGSFTWTALRRADQQKAAIIDEDKAILGGDDYFEISSPSASIEPGSGDYTIVWAARCHDVSDGYLGFSWYDAATAPSVVSASFGAASLALDSDSGGASNNVLGPTPSDGDRIIQTFRRDAGTEMSLWQNGTEGTVVTTGRLSNDLSTFTLPIRIGATSQPAFAEIEFVGAALFTRFLTDAEIAQVESELAL